MIETRALRECKPPPMPKCQPKVIQDSNLDFRINPDLYVHGICRKCWLQSCHQVWYKSAVDCTRNANKCPTIPYFAVVKKIKNLDWLIRNPHSDLDHHQKLITSRGSPLAHVCQVRSTSVSAFVSYPVYRMTEWQTERSHNFRLVGRGNKWQLFKLVDALCGCRLFQLIHVQHLDLSYNLLTCISSDIQNMT